ncbi:MAG: TolC family protein [Planctomycetia bacterium]|nr:TolC family protein [Planctomycetia bacterium]
MASAVVGWWAVGLGPAGAWQDSANAPRTTILEFPDLGPIRGSLDPGLPAPGALGTTPDSIGGSLPSGIVGGKRRSGRIPRDTGNRVATTVATNRQLQLPEALPEPTAAPPVANAAGGVADLALLDDEGPADGLSLDAAIEQMIRDNRDLRALRHELTQADADILTAGLRTNPLIYMDSQFIPYGSFSDQRPGGPPQYDINITYPLDVSGKRRSRTVVARMARSTIEAQYQDVTRRQIDNLQRAFVSLQSARIDHLAAAAHLADRRRRAAEFARSAAARGPTAADEADRLALAVDRAAAAAEDAAAAFADAQEGLAVLLSLPTAEVDGLAPRGSLRDPYPPPPEGEELTSLALRCRPDLRAARLGVDRAAAEVNLQRANRFDDIYLFYDPLTIQDNSVYRQQSATSWAVGLTFSLPVFNRNQGNIARAQSNVGQSRLELEALERRVAAEVRLAEREYRRSRAAVEQLERDSLPRVQAATARAGAALAAGQLSAAEYEERLDAAAEVIQDLHDAVVRHRRSMGDLNTAVGLRVLP